MLVPLTSKKEEVLFFPILPTMNEYLSDLSLPMCRAYFQTLYSKKYYVSAMNIMSP